MEEDKNHLIHKIIIRYILKTVRLLILIIFICFYVGIAIYIAFQISGVISDDCYEVNCFIKDNDFDHRTTTDKIIVMAYFSFTTLSTVGFGDYSAESSGERLIMIVVMVLGVMCFSYVMGLFTEIVNTFMQINHPIEKY